MLNHRPLLELGEMEEKNSEGPTFFETLQMPQSCGCNGRRRSKTSRSKSLIKSRIKYGTMIYLSALELRIVF
ncbi:hypothetical protein L1987_67153 [Smallanthus sonchifolius]|uniref:Uncharacterized protein n=1 Tax=Smallanthus sonchifolius TaxID=185202 RepID=A0ACB9BZD2_9ASTR|nr:hypothetical protein L1987_67153 [Smallanthus sonchifolius]